MKLTLVGWMAVGGFVISLILLIYVLKKESRKRDEGGASSWFPQTR